MSIQREEFGRTREGERVSRFLIENRNGNRAVATDYGCALLELWIRDRDGNKRNVVLGYPDLEGYLNHGDFLGACVGRFGGWIQKGEVRLHDRSISLNKTDGKNHLHGGVRGFDKFIWKSEIQGNRICFSRLSPAGEEHYPGNLKVKITYEFTDQDEWILCYEAECDEDTICNLTNHSYFNLEGRNSPGILDHELQIHSELVQEDNEDGISDWHLFPVEGTPFDSRKAKKIKKDLFSDSIQLKYGHGYDHNFYLKPWGEMRQAAVLYSEQSGIEMSVSTNQSGIQLYTANYLTGEAGNEKEPYGVHAGVCLETQYCPSKQQLTEGLLYPILRAGERYCHKTIYKFQIR